MENDSELRIIIRHVAGAKANQTEEFVVANRDAIKLGRLNDNDVVYDSPRDDIVSRSHAVIRIVSREPLRFSIEDAGSANGIFVGDRKIDDSGELLPEDRISLGRNGPSFVFDIRPRPEGLAARTRVMKAGDPAQTRVLGAAETMAAASTVIDKAAAAAQNATRGVDDDRARRTGSEKPGANAKTPIGEQTLLHKIGEARAAADSAWLKVAGGLAAAVVLGGGLGLFWLHSREAASQQTQEASVGRLREELDDANRKAVQASLDERRERGKSAVEIANIYGPATAKIVVNWRLFDKDTGRPIFHKLVKIDDEFRRAYVKMPDGNIWPYLTLEDDGRRNLPIGGSIEGSGFAVNAQGFILTNKHLAAAWRVPFFGAEFNDRKGALVEWVQVSHRGKRKWITQKTAISIDDEKLKNSVQKYTKNWIPQSAGIIFSSDAALPLGNINIPDVSKIDSREASRAFFGRNESMEVFFAGQKDPMTGSLERFSNETDVALIKVSTAQPLQRTVELAKEADDDRVSAGERVVVLGYPAVAAKTYAYAPVIENGAYRTRQEEIPKPYVTEGSVALLSTRMGAAPDRINANVTVLGELGDVMQLTINSTGNGNSGGPVFSASGSVIGIYTYRFETGGALASGAVPIKYGRALLSAQ